MKTLNLQLSRRLKEILGSDAPESEFQWGLVNFSKNPEDYDWELHHKELFSTSWYVKEKLPAYTFQEIDFKLLGEKVKYHCNDFGCGLYGVDRVKCCSCQQQNSGIPLALESWLYHAQRLNEIRLTREWEDFEKELGGLLKLKL